MAPSREKPRSGRKQSCASACELTEPNGSQMKKHYPAEGGIKMPMNSLAPREQGAAILGVGV
eukprot:5234259-Karenia_brevis.AAC.1